MSTGRPRLRLYSLVVIALVSCSMLMYEILLTRVSALRLHFHFSFLVVSNCLLGIGASGTLISLFQHGFRRRARWWIWMFTVLYVISLIGAYAFLLNFEIHADLNRIWSLQTVRFLIYTLAGAFPFFFGGCVVGLILTCNAEAVNTFYGLDLVGAALGCLLCPLFLAGFGAGGCFAFLTVLALVGALFAAERRYRRHAMGAAVVLIPLGLALIPRLDRLAPVPGKGHLDLTNKIHASLAREILEYSKWSAISRVDMMRVEPQDRLMLCRGSKDQQLPLPDQKMIVQDCVAATWISNFGENPQMLRVFENSMYSASMMLKNNPKVFIIGVGGGNDVWAARYHGAGAIKGIELNKQILDIHRVGLPEFSRAAD